MIRAVCLEILANGQEIWVAGLDKQGMDLVQTKASVYQCKFTSGFPHVKLITVDFGSQITEVIKLTRIWGTDNFVLACDNKLALFDTMNQKQYLIGDLFLKPIVDFSMQKDTIMIKGQGKGAFIMLKLDDKISHVFSKNHQLMKNSDISLKESKVTAPHKPIEITPFSFNQGSSFSPNKEEGVSGYSNLQDLKLSGLSTSRMESPQPHLPHKSALSVIYRSSPYDRVTVHKFVVPGADPLEKIAVNKKFNKLFCAGKKVYMLYDPTCGDRPMTVEQFESNLKVKELFGSRCSPRQNGLWIEMHTEQPPHAARSRY